MQRIAVALPHCHYEIAVGAGALAQLGVEVRRVAPHTRCVLFADRHVDALYGEAAGAALQTAGYAVTATPFDAGESNKTLQTVAHLYEVLLDAALERSSPVIGLGGGVTGDIVGFVAATYLRGVPLVQCPTTLLAMVDSSVGGKVGVNVAQGKNLIGAFYQPVLVLIDPHTLRTLPARELRCGLAECVKHGLLGDAALFAWTEANLSQIMGLEPAVLTELVARNAALKAGVVMRDEKEQGERALLNLGHTFAHAIEATCGYGVLAHGEAVSLGLVAAAWLSVHSGRCDRDVLERVRGLLERIGLPVRTALPPTAALLDAMRYDKKARDGRVRLILLDRIGAARMATDIDAADVAHAWEAIRA
jgi:3-dehydroquinate synthase